jgi:adenine-specific DNA-methyltransferase
LGPRRPSGRLSPAPPLFAVDARGRGYFLVWDGPGRESRLNRDTFHELAEEARQHDLTPPFHVYARLCTYSGPNVEFYQIPDRILDKLGFNATLEPFNIESDAGAEEVEASRDDAA